MFQDLGIIDRIAADATFYPPQREYRDDGTFAESSDSFHLDVDPSVALLQAPDAEEPPDKAATFAFRKPYSCLGKEIGETSASMPGPLPRPARPSRPGTARRERVTGITAA